jgi:hypothetical protein
MGIKKWWPISNNDTIIPAWKSTKSLNNTMKFILDDTFYDYEKKDQYLIKYKKILKKACFWKGQTA